MRLVVVAALPFVCVAGVLLTAAATSSSARHPSLRRFATDKRHFAPPQAQIDSGHHSLEQSHGPSLINGAMLDASWPEATKVKNKRALRGHTKDHAVSHRRQLSTATTAAVVTLSVEKDDGADRRHNVIVIEGADAGQVRVQRVEHQQNMTVIIAVYQDPPHTAGHPHRHYHRPHNSSTPPPVDVRDGSIFAGYNGSVHGHNITEAMVRVHELRMRQAKARGNESEHTYFVRWVDLANNTTRLHNTSSSHSTPGTSGHSLAQHRTISGTQNTTYLQSTSSHSDGAGRGAELIRAGSEPSGAASSGTLVEEKREVTHGVNRVGAVGGGLSVNGSKSGEINGVGGGEQTRHTVARVTPAAEAQTDVTHARARIRSATDAARHFNGSLSTKGVVVGQASGGVAGVKGGTTVEFGLNNGTNGAQAAAAVDIVQVPSSTGSSFLDGKARGVATEPAAEGRKQGPIGPPSDNARLTAPSGGNASSGIGGGGGGGGLEESGMAVLQDTTGHDEVPSMDGPGIAAEHQVIEAVVEPQRKQANNVDHVAGHEEDKAELTGHAASRPTTGGEERQIGEGRNDATAGDSVSPAVVEHTDAGAENGTVVKRGESDVQAGLRARVDRRSDEVGRHGQRHDQSAGLEVDMRGERDKDTRRGHDRGSRSPEQPHARGGQSSPVADGSGFGGVGSDAEDLLISTVQGAEATARVYGGNGHGHHVEGGDARRWHKTSVRADEALEVEPGGLSDAQSRREQHHHPLHEAEEDDHRHSYDDNSDDGRATRAVRVRGSGDRGPDGTLRFDDEEEDEQPEAGERKERTSAVPSGDDHPLQESEEMGGEYVTGENGGIDDTADAGGRSEEKVKKQKAPLFDWDALLKGLRVAMDRNGSMWVGSAQQAAEKQKQQLQQLLHRQQQQGQQQKGGEGNLFNLWGAIS